MLQAVKAALVSLTLLTALTTAAAHDHHTVGEGDNQFEITLGYAREPAYTDELNGLYLAVQDLAEEPVENLESSLGVAIIAPDGETRRELPLRAVSGEPGRYTSDFILSEPGVYSFEITGFIGETEVELNVPYGDEVAPLAELRFP